MKLFFFFIIQTISSFRITYPLITYPLTTYPLTRISSTGKILSQNQANQLSDSMILLDDNNMDEKNSTDTSKIINSPFKPRPGPPCCNFIPPPREPKEEPEDIVCKFLKSLFFKKESDLFV
jgi:hypothetical protein